MPKFEYHYQSNKFISYVTAVVEAV